MAAWAALSGIDKLQQGLRKSIEDDVYGQPPGYDADELKRRAEARKKPGYYPKPPGMTDAELKHLMDLKRRLHIPRNNDEEEQQT